MVNASKTRMALKEAKDLLSGVDEIVSAKGARIERLVMKNRPGDDALARVLIGPTGRLRAPTARIGRRLLVGFDEATYREALS